MTLMFSRLLEVVEVDVRPKFRQAKSNGSRVIVVTEKQKKTAENSIVVATADSNNDNNNNNALIYCVQINRFWI